MYDTLTLFVPVNEPEHIVRGLDRVKAEHSLETGEVTLSGYYRNLRVKTSGSGLTVHGSLSRYWQGSNVMAMNLEDCRNALQRLAEELGSSLDVMIVYRLDVAATLNMKYPQARYLRMFEDLPRFQRLERNGGVMYKTQRRELDFYDKRAESRKHRNSLPTSFNGRHALRYELRYRQQLKEQFGGQVTAARLIDPNFFSDVVGRWETAYKGIRKQAGVSAFQLDTSSPKMFGASLERCAIQHLGKQFILEELRTQRDCGEIDRLTYSRLRKRIGRGCTMQNVPAVDSPIAELDTAIAAEAQRLVAGCVFSSS